MRVIFMGTPDFAVPALVALVAAGHEVVAAYSQPPRPGGRRGRELTPSPVQREAEARGIAVRHPVSLKGAEEQATFAAWDADIAVVAAYGLILPQAILDAPRLGCLNIHASLLPRWRGAAPIQRAILAGDEETGVCIMQMERGLDTGPVRLCKKSWIGSDTAGQVTARLSELGAKSIVQVLSDPASYPPVPQPEDGVTYARKIHKAEAKLDFPASSEELARKVRAFNPTPGAHFELAGERVKVLRAVALDRWKGHHDEPGRIVDLLDARFSKGWSMPHKRCEAFAISCGEGYLLPIIVQRAGKKPMSLQEALRGWEIPWDEVVA